MGSTLILTNLVRVHQKNIHSNFEANPCSSLTEVEKKFKISQRQLQALSDHLSHTHSMSLTKKSMILRA